MHSFAVGDKKKSVGGASYMASSVGAALLAGLGGAILVGHEIQCAPNSKASYFVVFSPFCFNYVPMNCSTTNSIK